MKVTFLIGNGFDLKIGMKTRYVDMYDSYIAWAQVQKDNKEISAFCERLCQDKPNKYTNWSDFEVAMGMYASQVENEEEFIKCVRSFKGHMIKCLEEEQSRFLSNTFMNDWSREVCKNVIKDSLYGFYLGQTPNAIKRIEEFGRPVNFSFVSFNYTHVFDILVEKSISSQVLNGPIIHIHGYLGSDVVLGLDNEDQFDELNYSISKKMQRAFIKPDFNMEYDSERVRRAERAINNSDVICIYGMSLGISDQSWVDRIAKWLRADQNHHLVCFRYSEDQYEPWDVDLKMDEEDRKKLMILERLYDEQGDREAVFNNVHIPIGFDIFNVVEELNKRSGNKEIA